MIDQRRNGTGAGSGLIRTAHTRHEKTLEANRLAQILQFDQQRRAGRQIAARAVATLRCLTPSQFHHRCYFRRLGRHFNLVGFAGFAGFAEFTGFAGFVGLGELGGAARCDNFRRCPSVEVGDGEVEFVGVLDQRGDGEFAQIEQRRSDVTVGPLKVFR